MTNFQYDVIGGRPGSAAPGTLTRVNEPHEIVSGLPLASNPPTVFGNAVVRDASTGNFRPVGSADVTANVYGLVVKPFGAQTSTSWPPAGWNTTSTVSATDTLSIGRMGYFAVQVDGATAPVQGGAVYIQTTAVTGIPVGSFSAVSSADNFQWVGAEWAVSGVDSQGFGEIRFRVA